MRLARQAIAEAGRAGDCAAAFCINSSLLDERASGRLELLSWVWNDEPPDLVILETLETIPDDVALETISMVCDTGLPVWVSFRRQAEGMSRVDGGVVPDPDPGAFAHALERLERIGVSAVLVNCVPVHELERTVEACAVRPGCRSAATPTSATAPARAGSSTATRARRSSRDLATTWVAAGARIVGGCCGVTPAHIAGLRPAVGRPRAVESGI